MSVPEYKLEDIIKSAIGDKPVNVQKAFDNVIVQRAADIIAGKREEIAATYGAAIEQPQTIDQPDKAEDNIDDNDLLADLSDEELDKLFTDDELDDEDDVDLEDTEEE